MSEKQIKGIKRRKKKKRIGVKILVALLVLAFLGIGVMYSVYAANRMDISDYQYQAKDKTEIYSADNQVIAQLYMKNRTNVTIDQIPVQLQQALISVEDSRFYDHFGIDLYGIGRAFFANIASNGIGEGASTITQQLARVLFLPDIATEQNFNQSLVRKLKEISIALQLEKKYTKEQILEMYFNEYYFGSGAYGIEEAAQTYFGKPVSQVNLAEAAMLAGLPQAPSAYAPNSDFEAAKKRQLEVLVRMVKEKYITQEEADAAAATELVIRDPATINNDDQIVDGYEAFVGKALDEYAKTKASAVMQERGITEDQAIDYIKENIASGGYRIYTTINTAMQTTAIDSIGVKLDDFGLYEETASVVTVDLDGAVMAYYGGNSQIDMADTPRQPGSNIKPLFYAAAMDKGLITPSTTILDSYTDFGGYAPKNYDGSYHGNVTVRNALVYSYNIPAVKVFDKVGIDEGISFMQQMGISTFEEEDYNLATALGGMTYGIKPVEMAAAFNTFNDGGIYRQPYFINKIEQVNGTVIYTKDNGDLISRKVMADSTATDMMSILTDEVRLGTGRNANQIYTTAGKTGTTNDEKDFWFTGMTGNLTTAVWIGSQDNHIIGGASAMAAGIYGLYLEQVINQNLVATPELERTSNEASDSDADMDTDTSTNTRTNTRTTTPDTTTPTTNKKDTSGPDTSDEYDSTESNTTTPTTKPPTTPDTTTPDTTTPDTTTPDTTTPDTTTPDTTTPGTTGPSTPETTTPSAGGN